MIARVSPSPPSPSPSSIPLKLRIFYVVLNLVLSLAARFAKRRDGTFNRAIFAFLDVRAPPSPARGPDGIATSDHAVDPSRDLSVRYFSPPPPPPAEGTPPLPVVVYFHGGGFVSGSARSPAFDGFCRRLSAALRAHVLSVEYRLAPEHRFPAPLDDGLDVLRWLDAASADLPSRIGDLSSVFLAGDSAGGNIAHHVARRAAGAGYRRVRIAGLVSIQPFLGGEADTESERLLPFVSREHLKWIWRSFLPQGSDCDHEAANVFGPGSSSGGGDWNNFPATMVVVGGLDSLQDRQRCYYRGLRRMGVEASLKEYPNGVHSFHVFTEFPEARQLLHDVGEFVQRHCQKEEK